jgi:hypothetical protein
MLSVIKEAAEKVGGVPELARRLGVSRQAIDQWTEVPPERAADLERVTGIPRSRLRPDLFGQAPQPPESSDLHDRDHFAWAMRQADLLAAQRFSELDLANLVEEIADLGGSIKREIRSRLRLLLMHLLKWAYQPEHRSGSWSSTVIEQRESLIDLIRESPSLRTYPADVLAQQYTVARRLAAAETDLSLQHFPEQCPFTIEQVLDPDFMPKPP